MTSYFNQIYNWYWDIHPFRPTMIERKQKDLVTKQIRETKNFKFRKIKEEKQPIKQVSGNTLLIQSLLKNKNKINLLNSHDSVKKT